MQTVLLASGNNTRVAHLYPDLPKVMFPVNGRPYLAYYLDQLFETGATSVIILVHYRKEKIIDFVNSLPEERKGKITIIERNPDEGPVKALVGMEALLEEQFMLFYCDLLYKVDLAKAKQVLADGNDVCVFATPDSLRMFNDMELAVDPETNKITAFAPHEFTHETGLMDVGQLNRRSILDHLREAPEMAEHANSIFWPKLITDNKLGFITVDPVLDVGTEINYKKTVELLSTEGPKILA
jgi:NDP-sugar pyrophosphorylase family protein